MRYLFGGLAIVALFHCRPAPIPEAALVLSDCPETALSCVEMLLDAPSISDVLRAEAPMDSTGFAELTLAVPGHFGTSTIRTHSLRFRAYRDGIDCSAFGQGNAAVLGFAASGAPILLTTAGPFTAATGALRAGCSDCLRVRGESATFPTPAWDLTLTGHTVEQFGFLNSGEPVLRTPSGCVVLTGRFRHFSRSECATRLAPDREPDVRSQACT